MNEIVQFKADSGSMVEITPQDVTNYLCPNATVQEVGLFLQLCAAQRLNPWVGEVYLIKYGDKPAQIQAGKEAFTKRAAANPDYEGFEAGVTFTDAAGRIRQREGSAVYPSVGETLVGGWCRVFVKGRKPYFDEVSLQEYTTGRNLWATKPATMIRKVALVHCLREAFPDAFAGLYSAEELDQSNEQRKQAAQAQQGASVQAASVMVEEQPQQQAASAEQCEEIGNRVAELAAVRGVDFTTAYNAVFGSKALQALGFVDDSSLTDAQARAALHLIDLWYRRATADRQALQVPEYVDADTGEIAPEYETE